MDKRQSYERLFRTLDSLCDGETDHVAIMATIACELYHAFVQFDWVGFYRNVDGQALKIGPYQGRHGCLTIPFSQGVCGKCARERAVQNVPDVLQAPHHIACSSRTRSELVAPCFDRKGQLVAVLDVDSETVGVFDSIDREWIPRIAALTADGGKG